MKSLVVLIDGENLEPARRAVRWLEPGGTLHLVGVLKRPANLPDSLWPQSSALLATELAHSLEQALAALDLPAEIHGQTHVAEGETAAALSRMAAQVQAEAVVMDGESMNSWRRLFAPSAAQELLKRGQDTVILTPRREPR